MCIRDSFNIVSGAYPPTSGFVIFEGKDITQLPAAETARLAIARTFQIAHSFRNMSVLDNVIVGCGHRVYGSISRLVERYKTREIREKSVAFLDMVGLAEHADTLAGKLPIAQQRRMEVARALALDPKLLLLDEPCAGLTYGETESLMDLVHKVRETGVTVVMVCLLYTSNSVYPTMGSVPAYKAMAIAVMGGLGNVWGTVIASLILGLVETFLVTSPLAFILPRDSIAFVALILVLLFRPHGLFGRR